MGESDRRQAIELKIEERLGRLPESYALTAYDALWVAVFVNLEVISDNDESLRVAINVNTETYYGISGWTILNKNEDREYWDYDIWTVAEENGSYQWEKDERVIMRGEKLIVI